MCSFAKNETTAQVFFRDIPKYSETLEMVASGIRFLPPRI